MPGQGPGRPLPRRRAWEALGACAAAANWTAEHAAAWWRADHGAPTSIRRTAAQTETVIRGPDEREQERRVGLRVGVGYPPIEVAHLM